MVYMSLHLRQVQRVILAPRILEKARRKDENETYMGDMVTETCERLLYLDAGEPHASPRSATSHHASLNKILWLP